MEIFVIPPLPNLSLMNEGDNYFCLAHFYIQYKDYRDFFIQKRDEGAFIILDNSAAEKSLVDEDILINIVSELKPNEVISPDVLFDKDNTLKNLEKFIIRMKENGYDKHTNIFAVPQGNTREEWIDCYKSMVNNKDVHTIGLSKISVPHCWLNANEDSRISESRNDCIDYLDYNRMIVKPIHFLGMGDPREYLHYTKINDNKLLRSTDSCYTILASIHNIMFDEDNFKRLKTYNEYYTEILNDESELLAKRNINYLKELIENV